MILMGFSWILMGFSWILKQPAACVWGDEKAGLTFQQQLKEIMPLSICFALSVGMGNLLLGKKTNTSAILFRNPLVSLKKWSTQVVWYDVNPGFMERLTGWTPINCWLPGNFLIATSKKIGGPRNKPKLLFRGWHDVLQFSLQRQVSSKHQDLMSEEWL